MAATHTAQPVLAQKAAASQTGRLLILWIGGGLVLLALVLATPLDRTQEARVLETAREMIDQGGRHWIVPHLNGRVRLHKPPLAYWLTAISFKAFGVSTPVGRLPMALAGWLTLGLVWRIGREMVGNTGALVAAAGLAGTLLFQRYAGLAETDVMSMLFITTAVYAIWRGSTAGGMRPALGWNLLSGVALGLEGINKGPPVAFALLFLIGLSMVNRDGRILLRWLASGALLLAAAIALPWWITALKIGSQTIAREIRDVSTGRDHYGTFYLLFGFALQAVLPWVGFVLLAIIAGISNCRRDKRLVPILIWCAAIFIPLLIIPQKQPHYLMPLMPAMMVLTGWAIERALNGLDSPLEKATTWVLGGTTVAGLGMAVAVIIIALRLRGLIHVLDVGIAAAMAVSMVGLIVLYRWRGLGTSLVIALLIEPLLLAGVLGPWARTLKPATFDAVAAGIHKRCPGRPYAFYGIENIPLVFEMRQVVPLCATPADLDQALAAQPNLAVIIERLEAPEPPGMTKAADFPMGGKKTICVYIRPGTEARK